MLGSFHFYVTLEQLHEKVCKCYYPLCWVLFISTKTKPYLNMELKRYYPLCWVLFISTKTKPYLNMELKRYYPLCWVLFISTSKALGQTCTRVSLLPTMLGSFHFYINKIKFKESWKMLLPTMLGSFHFYRC